MASSLEEPGVWLGRAKDALGAARLLLDKGSPRESVSKAYYAMFYAAKAAIVSEWIEANKHSAVISAFGPRFAKTGRVPSNLHGVLRTAFDERQLADYTLDWEATPETVQSRLAEAEQFVAEVATLLGIPE